MKRRSLCTELYKNFNLKTLGELKKFIEHDYIYV